MVRTRAVPRRRPNINFQQRGFERRRVAATRNIISSGSSSATSVRSPSASPPASPIVRPKRRIRRRINSESSSASSPARNQAKSPAIRRRIRRHDMKIKFVLPRVKNIDVKHNGRVVRKMIVRRVAKHAAKKKNVRYG